MMVYPAYCNEAEIDKGIRDFAGLRLQLSNIDVQLLVFEHANTLQGWLIMRPFIDDRAAVHRADVLSGKPEQQFLSQSFDRMVEELDEEDRKSLKQWAQKVRFSLFFTAVKVISAVCSFFAKLWSLEVIRWTFFIALTCVCYMYAIQWLMSHAFVCECLISMIHANDGGSRLFAMIAVAPCIVCYSLSRKIPPVLAKVFEALLQGMKMVEKRATWFQARHLFIPTFRDHPKQLAEDPMIGSILHRLDISLDQVSQKHCGKPAKLHHDQQQQSHR